MLVLHPRTVAFIASLSTTIQCILWFAGYILYILAYSCSYQSTYFLPYQNVSLPLNLHSYFIWYFQGSNCTTTNDWISSTRGESSELLVILFSVGLAINCFVFGISIAVIIRLYTNLRLYYTIFVYSIAVYIISIWDVILMVIVGLDFTPLLDLNNYYISKTQLKSLPGDIALPFFTNVLTIIIILLSRLIVIWLFNVLSVTFLLFRNKSVKTEGQGNIDSQANKTKNGGDSPTEKMQESPWIHNDSDEKYWGSLAPKSSPLSKWHLPAPRDENLGDEVNRRWTMTTGIYDEDSPLTSRGNSVVGDSEHIIKVKSGSVVNNKVSTNEERWKEVENHIKSNEEKWKNQSVLPNVRKSESFSRTPASPKRSSFLKSVRDSFKKTSSFTQPPQQIQPPEQSQITPEEQQVKPKVKDGFTYTPNHENKTGHDIGMFGVKLRHVRRPSDDDTNSDHQEEHKATPYAVSTIPDFKPGPPVSDSSRPTTSMTPNSPPVVPPDAPPLKDSSHANFKAQMSLEEAIRTRRPLKPINRPTIDMSN